MRKRSRVLPPEPIPTTSEDQTRAAFTRLELCAALAALSLLTAIAWPALASSKADNERVVCFNNLRMIGRGVIEYASEHNGFAPWRVPVAEGGTMMNPKPGNAWAEYSSLSNQLVTPRVFACPSDAGVLAATNFASYRVGGMRQNATSYHLNLDVFPSLPTALISTDRNIRSYDGASGCSAGVNSVGSFNRSANTVAAWTNAVHGTNSGHVLRMDGAVLFTDTPGLKEALRTGDGNEGVIHILNAR
jgi:hypothetical protein